MPRPTIAEIDLSAIRDNLRAIRSLIGPAVEIIATVKADAYGHGAVPVARALAAEGVKQFGVALVEEGAALREAGIAGEILVLGALLPEDAPEVVRHELEAAVSDLDFARRLDEVSRRVARRGERGRPTGVHVKLDTGLGRLGFPPERALDAFRELADLRGLRLVGAMTHFSSADEAGEGAEFTRGQWAAFLKIRQAVAAAGIQVPLWHAAGSAAILLHPDSHLDAVRPGIALYGGVPAAQVPPFARAGKPMKLRQAMTLKTRIALVRDFPPGATLGYGRTFRTARPSRIAALPIGYADGFSRANSNRGQALVRGRRVPIVGRVSMDIVLVDVTDAPGAAAGDEVVLYGRQGEAEISIVEAAATIGTISYELMTALTARVPRVYVQG
jgi:alanine racemase